MIRAVFSYSFGKCHEVVVEGHADFAKFGNDIVCSAVSSAVRLFCNGISEIVKEQVEIKINDGKISLKFLNSCSEKSEILVKSLKLELGLIEKEYPKNIKLKIVNRWNWNYFRLFNLKLVFNFKI